MFFLGNLSLNINFGMIHAGVNHTIILLIFWQDINDFMYTQIDSTRLEIHVELAQALFHTCLQFPELQNEFYCQMIKQLSPHPVTHKTAVQVRYTWTCKKMFSKDKFSIPHINTYWISLRNLCLDNYRYM